MKANASQSKSSSQSKKVVSEQTHVASFAKVLDGRKQPVRGLWERNRRFYAQVSIEDFATGLKRVRRVPLNNAEGKPVETVAQAITELNRLRTHRSEDTLPQLGQTPTFAKYADEYVKTVKAAKEKKTSTIDKEEHIIDLWKNHLGGIRLDKIRPVHVAGFMDKRLKAGMSKRTVKLDVIVLRNVLKQARDVEEIIRELPVPAGVNRKLKSVAPKRELFTPAELDQLCASAMAKDEDGAPVTKNGVQFCDYIRLMAYSGARRNEALALRWADVDELGEKLTIERQAGGDEGKDETPKNGEGRTVDFNPALKKLLLEMKDRRAPDSQWLFPSPQRGKKDIHAMSFRESLELARDHAKLRKVGFHDLRHLFISYCVMAGIDYMTIAKWVGHKDGGILIGKVYGHLAETHTKEQAKLVHF
ncbi:MAG: tyrosine-type recombinase/integrase [Verrucomicrobiota bacterium]